MVLSSSTRIFTFGGPPIAFSSYEDGFSGQQMEFIIPIPPQAGSIVNITWKGRNQRVDQGVFTMGSKDGWISFTSFHTQVLRTYVLYTAETVMALTETYKTNLNDKD